MRDFLKYQIIDQEKQGVMVRGLYLESDKGDGKLVYERVTNFKHHSFVDNPSYSYWLLYFYKEMKGLDQRQEIEASSEVAEKEAREIYEMIERGERINQPQALFLDLYFEMQNRNALPFYKYDTQKTYFGEFKINKILGFKKDGFRSKSEITGIAGRYNNHEEIEAQFFMAKQDLLKIYPEIRLTDEIDEANKANAIINKMYGIGEPPTDLEIKYAVAWTERDNHRKLSAAFFDRKATYTIAQRGEQFFLLDKLGNMLNIHRYTSFIGGRDSKADLINLSFLISGREVHVDMEKRLPDHENSTLLRLIESDIRAGNPVSFGDAIFLSSYYAKGGKQLTEQKEVVFEEEDHVPSASPKISSLRTDVVSGSKEERAQVRKGSKSITLDPAVFPLKASESAGLSNNF